MESMRSIFALCCLSLFAILIHHRPSTLRNADLIIVMDRGAILETRTHYSLMEQRGLYYYLNSRQSEG